MGKSQVFLLFDLLFTALDVTTKLPLNRVFAMDALNMNSLSFRENETFLKSFSDGPKGDKGQLFLYLDLPDNPGAEDSVAEKIWRALHDTFFNCQSDAPEYCFEQALKAVNEVIEQEHQKRESGTIGRINGVACLLQDEVLHFSQTGLGAVYLRRAGFCAQISEDPENEAEAQFSSISTGELEGGDTLACATRHIPFSDDVLMETFADTKGKIASHIKDLSKKKEMVGLIAYDVIPAKSAAVTADEPDEEPSEVPVDLMDEDEMMDEEVETSSKKGVLSNLKVPISTEKMGKAKETLKGVFGGVSSKMKKLVDKPDRIKQVNRRYVMLAIIGLIVILGILFNVQSNYREQAAQAEYYENLLSQVKNNISIAENRFLIGEKSDATDFLNKAATSLDEIKTAGFFMTDVDKLEKEIVLYRDNFDQIIRVESPTVFVDLSEKGTVDALGIINTEDQKNFVYEPRRLFETLLNKVQEPVTLDADEIVLSGAELSDFSVLSFITQSGQVLEYSMRNGTTELANTLDQTWNKGIDIKTFNGEFIYLLDPQSNSIWKYRRLRTAYSNASVYSTQGDLSNAVSMAIDGEIYVLNRDGSVLRYRSGDQLTFEFKDSPSVPVEQPTRIYTLPEANNLYILDSQNSRVVVYSKEDDGMSRYQKQVIFEDFEPGEIKDFTVDRDEQKLTVLTADKVYITDL